MDTKGSSRIRVVYVLGVIGLRFLTLFVTGLGQATPTTTFTVNTTEDINDGVCDAAHCTLREAINAANNAVGADTIDFTLPPSATITLAGSQLPTITDTLTIDGSTAVNLTISGDNLTRTFDIESGTAMTLTSLTIRDGRASRGGAVYNDDGVLRLNNIILSDNSADSYGYGGGVFNMSGLIFINDSVLSDNSADVGGGLYIYSGTVIINNSTFVGNDANYGGGGIYKDGGITSIISSTIVGNDAGADAGGGILNSGLMKIVNSTISMNYALADFGGGRGGGIFNNYDATMYIIHTTLSGNSTSTWHDTNWGGGIYTAGTITMSNTIIANSYGGDCVTVYGIYSINNLVEDGSCNATFSGDPSLGPLQDNGGPTWTHALLPFSLAVDNGDDAICAAPPVNNHDQRGVIRPLDGDGDGTPKCDIGAYEYDGPPPDRFYLPLLLKN